VTGKAKVFRVLN